MYSLKKTVLMLLTLALFVSLVAPCALAADSNGCAVIGADLSSDEIDTVYGMFGVSRGSVPELTVSNAEERQVLEGKVDDSAIGSLSISCVYIELLPESSGLSLSSNNISWCTNAVYENALVTAGIYDAKVIIAAPFAVSGTAALTGIYKAYESMTGETLDEAAKIAAVDELITTSELADVIGSADASDLVNQLKVLLGETSAMTDDELRQEILSIAGDLNVALTDDQITPLIGLVRQMEKLDTAQLTEKVEEVQGVVRQFGDVASNATGFFGKITDFFDGILAFFQRLFGSAD